MYNGDCIRETCFSCLHDNDCKLQQTCDNCYWYILTGSLLKHYECIKDFDLPVQTDNGKTCELYEKNR